jgi:hypothetical protein
LPIRGPGLAFSCIRAPRQGHGDRRRYAARQKKPRHLGGARLTAWRFPKEGRPIFIQNLRSDASEKLNKGPALLECNLCKIAVVGRRVRNTAAISEIIAYNYAISVRSNFRRNRASGRPCLSRFPSLPRHQRGDVQRRKVPSTDCWACLVAGQFEISLADFL